MPVSDGEIAVRLYRPAPTVPALIVWAHGGGYVLGSPSYWFDQHVMERMEQASAATLKDMPAKVYFYIGEYEAKRVGDLRYLQDDDMVEDARRMERTLRSRGYPSLVMRLDVLLSLNVKLSGSVTPSSTNFSTSYRLPVCLYDVIGMY